MLESLGHQQLRLFTRNLPKLQADSGTKTESLRRHLQAVKQYVCMSQN